MPVILPAPPVPSFVEGSEVEGKSTATKHLLFARSGRRSTRAQHKPLATNPTPDDCPAAEVMAAVAARRQRVFLRSVAVVTASVFLSRVLGFFREWAIAHQVGATGLTDAYYAAFTIPDVLNYLLAGGALSITFIPVFLEYFATERKEEAWAVFSTVLTVMTTVLVALVIVAEIYAATLTAWIAPGFTPDAPEADVPPRASGLT